MVYNTTSKYFLKIFTKEQLIDILECFKNKHTILLAVNLINNELKKHKIEFRNNRFTIFSYADLRIELITLDDIASFDIRVNNRLVTLLYLHDVFDVCTKGEFYEMFEDRYSQYIISILKNDTFT